MPIEAVVFGLVFFALALGWWLGRRQANKQLPNNLNNQLSNEYFTGLNYLLNEQPDEAIETFRKALTSNAATLNADTIETHLALGSLFRKRGESEKAVRLHQNLFARPSLTKEQSYKVQLELAKDFLAAGLLDRAEKLLVDFNSTYSSLNLESQLLLIELYEKQQDWHQALLTLNIELLRAYPQLKHTAAHYSCELASQALSQNNLSRARKLLKQAASYDASCVRSSLLSAQLELDNANPKAALRYLNRIPEQDINFLPLMLAPLQDAYALLNKPKKLLANLEQLLANYKFTSLIICLADNLVQAGQQEAALVKLEDYLRPHPSLKGVDYLINLYLQTASASEKSHLLGLKNLTSQLLEQKPNFQCNNCGFTSQQHFWQCPKCKTWGSHKPIRGVEGE